jgi:holo-[acyl-carrier protein] synthase
VAGVGIDVVDLERFRTLLSRRSAAPRRLFTEAEQAYASSSSDPAKRLAARFAAKEATMKALGVGIGAVRFRDMEVLGDGGRPTLQLAGRAARLAEEMGITCWHISLSHSDLVAVASVLAASGPGA